MDTDSSLRQAERSEDVTARRLDGGLQALELAAGDMGNHVSNRLTHAGLQLEQEAKLQKSTLALLQRSVNGIAGSKRSVTFCSSSLQPSRETKKGTKP